LVRETNAVKIGGKNLPTINLKYINEKPRALKGRTEGEVCLVLVGVRGERFNTPETKLQIRLPYYVAAEVIKSIKEAFRDKAHEAVKINNAVKDK